MSDENILEKVIEKAVENGYDLEKDSTFTELNYNYWCCGKSKEHYQFIFSHSFARAFWGYEHCTVCNGTLFKEAEGIGDYCIECGSDSIWNKEHAWQYHLQQIVLEEEPLKYLEKFLDKA